MTHKVLEKKFDTYVIEYTLGSEVELNLLLLQIPAPYTVLEYKQELLPPQYEKYHILTVEIKS